LLHQVGISLYCNVSLSARRLVPSWWLYRKIISNVPHHVEQLL